MGQTIGVIGTPDLVRTVLEIARQFQGHTFLDLHYEDETETVSIFRANKDKMQVCLFTGNWPYAKVKAECQEREISIPLVYISDAGSAVHKTISKLLIDGVDVRRLSIDTITPQEAAESFGEIGLSLDGLYLMPFAGPIRREEFVSFHKSLWKSGKTAAAITFLRTAYLELKQHGVPVYRCTPSTGALREAVVKAVLEAQAIETRSYQLVIGLTEMASGRSSAEVYKNQRKRAVLFQSLLEFGEATGISVVPMEGTRFGLFMTRGTLEEVTSGYSSFDKASEITKACSEKVFIGFGVARTAALCYANAELALKYSREAGGGCAFVVSEEGRVIGPLASDGGLDFRRSTVDKKVLNQALASGLSISTIGKVKSVLARNSTTLITPEQLALSLSISKRNSRRILAKLCAAGLAEVSGLDQPGTRGRPQRVYQINLK